MKVFTGKPIVLWRNFPGSWTSTRMWRHLKIGISNICMVIIYNHIILYGRLQTRWVWLQLLSAAQWHLVVFLGNLSLSRLEPTHWPGKALQNLSATGSQICNVTALPLVSLRQPALSSPFPFHPPPHSKHGAHVVVFETVRFPWSSRW